MISLKLEAVVRPSILKLKAYQSARSLTTQARVFLDANEAPDGAFNRYPTPQPEALLNRFSALYATPGEHIVMGRGSDEAIDLLTRALCEPGRDAVMITPPTYGMYEVSAAIQNAEVVTVPLLFNGEAWKLDTATMIASAQTESVKIVYVCSPNNPTGSVFTSAEIRNLCAGVGPNVLVVLDEAYIEFTPESSCVPLLNEFQNLAILRTLSKAWGLAGIRCGVVLATPELAAILHKVRAPYPLAQPVVAAALAGTDELALQQMLTRVQHISYERERMTKALKSLPGVETVFSSQANFILARFENVTSAMNTTRAKGIVLRSRANELGLDRCIRITIGTEEENSLLLSTLDSRTQEDHL